MRTSLHARAALIAVSLALVALVAPSAPPALAAGGGWTTFMGDNARDGRDAADPAFGTVGPAWTSPALGGQIFAEPLVYGGLVYVATQNNWLYALNQGSGTIAWSLNLGPAASGFPCGNINGITGTPVIDTANNVLYAVGAVGPGVTYKLFKVNLATHAVTSTSAQPASGFDPTIQGQRGALGLANGRVYVPYGGRAGDCGQYHGWVLAFDLNGNLLGTFKTTPYTCAGGVWAPGGESIDAGGNVYAASGNGPTNGLTGCAQTGSYDYQESVFKLPATPTATPAAIWAPQDWYALDQGDTDIGSVTPTLLTGTSLLFQAGKNSRGYVLDTNALGNGPSSNTGIDILGAGECMGSSAWDGAKVYVGCDGGLYALAVNTATKSFSVAWSAGSAKADSPILAGGAVWVMDRSHNLTAYNPSNGAVVYTVNLGASNSFSTPSAAGGTVFAGAGNRVKAFTMFPAQPGGYNILTSFGGIYSFGDAHYYGNLIDHGYPGPAIGLAETPDGGGYDILTTFGGVYSFGNAGYFGNLIDHGFPGPAVAVAMTPSGNGYAILTVSGGLYTFGDAHYYGNLIDHGYPGPAVSVSYTPTGAGYVILTASGGVYTFGDASYYGNLLDHGYPGPAVSVAYTRSGGGYWVLTQAGAIYTFGDANYQGNLLDHGYPGPAVAISNTP